MNGIKVFIQENTRRIALAVLTLVIAVSVILLLPEESAPSNDNNGGAQVEGNQNDDNKDETDADSNDNMQDQDTENQDETDADSQDKNEEVVVEDTTKPVNIGIQMGNTKYDKDMGEVTYDEEGVILYNSVRDDEDNLFFATGQTEYDSIGIMLKGLKKWEEGGLYVNGYKEDVALVKHAENGWYAYFTNDGAPILELKPGDLISIQGTLTDGEGGEVTFLPATFKYTGGYEWPIVSREPIEPKEKPAQHITTKIVGVPSDRIDRNLFFYTEDICPLGPSLPATIWDWTEGGIYVDGKRVSVPIIKYGGQYFYIYAAFDNWSTIDPVVGTRIGIQGTMTDGKNTTTLEPITFEHLGGGEWKIVSRDQVIPETDKKHELKPGEKEVYLYDNYRADKNLIFSSSANDTVPYSEEWKVYYRGTTGGVYVDGVLNKGFVLIKTSANGYMLWMEHGGITPVDGMRISIQGTFKRDSGGGTEEITYHPATFEYDGKGWYMVSREEIDDGRPKPGEGEKEVYIYEDYKTDSALWFATSNNDTVPHDASWSCTYAAKEGGIYVNGRKNESLVLVKVGSNSYLIYFTGVGITPTTGMQVTIQGTFAKGADEITYHPVTFEYDGTGWALISRDALEEDKPLPEEGEKEVYLYEDYRAGDTTVYFTSSSNDKVPYGNWSVVYGATTGGVYINGVKKDGVVIMKNGENFYMLWMGHIAGYTPASGDTIHIEGTFAYGTDEITYHPATFEYDGSGWKLVGRDSIIQANPDKPEPEEGEKEVYLYEDYRAGDTTVYFTSSSNDKVPYGNWSVVYGPTTGGVYINGVKKDGVVIMKNGENFYMLWMGHIAGYTPASGDTIHIEGTFAYGTDEITYHPATFEYDGSGWKLVGRDSIIQVDPNKPQPGEGEKEVYIYEKVGVADSNLSFETSDNDRVPHNASWACTYAARDGGIYVNGTKNDALVLVKVGSNSYLIYFTGVGIAPTAGMKVVIQGTFVSTSASADEVTYHPVTFEYDGTTWKLISREEYKPNRPEPGEGEKEVYIYEDYKADHNMSFTTSSNDTVPHGNWSILYKATTGGIYVDGAKITDGLFMKNGENVYLLYMPHLGLDATTITTGMQIHIEGTFADHLTGENEITYHPVTFEYDGTGWRLVSRESMNFDRPEPEEGEKEVYIYEDYKADYNMSFTTSSNDTVPHGNWSVLYKATTGGIYVNGVKDPGAVFMKNGENVYLLYMPHLGLDATTVTTGMQIHIEGTFADHLTGENEITYHPVTFQYDGTGWKVVSRESMNFERPEPAAGEREVYLYEEYHAGDTTIYLRSSSNDTVPHGNWSVVYSATTGGVYVNGVKKNGVVIMKNGENLYMLWMGHIANYTPVTGDTIHIEGTFAYGTDEVTYHPVTVKYDGSGWKLISRQPLTTN